MENKEAYMTKSKHVKLGFFAFTVSAVFLFSAALPSWAIPASPFPFTVTQPDGTTVKLYKRGDEFRNWTESAEGYTVLKNEVTGYWEFAVSSGSKLVSTGVTYSPGKTPPAGLEKHQMPETSATFNKTAGVRSEGKVWTPRPIEGKRKIMFIRVEFGDREFTVAEELHRDQVFGTSSSVKKYYLDQSLGKLEIVPAIEDSEAVTVKLAKHPFPNGFRYAFDDEEKMFEYEVAFVTKVLEAVKDKYPCFDLSKYDTNPKDGVVTPKELCVYMILAGYEEATTDKIPAVWAHAKNSEEKYKIEVDNVVLAAWAMQGELLDGDEPQQIGAMAHELGHQFCYLPDLYDVSDVNAGLGRFSLMAAGNWGKKEGEIQGSSPVNLDAWSRLYLGWETPQQPVSGSVTFATPELGKGKGSAQLLMGGHRTTEYFLAEVRDLSGWDAGFEGLFTEAEETPIPPNFNGGLLIMHVDETIGSGSLEGEESNDINDAKKNPHQGVMAVDANNPQRRFSSNLEERSDGGMPHTLWWGDNPEIFEPALPQSGATNKTVDFKTPESNFYNGVITNISVTGIGNPENGKLTATVATRKPGGSWGGCDAGAGSDFAAVALIGGVYLASLTRKRVNNNG